MSRIGLKRKQVRLKALTGIRARLVLMALILVAPLMVERVRSLEAARARQVAEAVSDFAALAQHSAEAQREVLSSVEAVLRTAAHIRTTTSGILQSCEIIRTSLHVELPWIRTMSILGSDGRIQCATIASSVGLDLSDRAYFKDAQRTRAFVLSDYIFSRVTNVPTIIGALPVSAVGGDDESAVIIAAVSLDWMSRIMSNLGGRPGVSAVMVDGEGTVLAAPPDQAALVGQPYRDMVAVTRAIDAAPNAETVSYVGQDGEARVASLTGVSGTGARLIVSIDEAKIAAATDRDILSAYIELAVVCLFVLLGALVVAEKLIIRPIRMIADVAKTFGRGDWSRRIAPSRLPIEYSSLSRALNAMAAQLGQRERELVATNDRLTVMVSMDMLSGLANRRGFQSRLDFEWLKALNQNDELSLLMIDVDYFKLFNDTYGHPEGDACLACIGDVLAAAAAETAGAAARYGGEEFVLLLPGASMAQATDAAEKIRQAVEDVGLPNAGSPRGHLTVSIGVASTAPSERHQPSDLIEAADSALYTAKRTGRNAVARHGFARPSDAAAHDDAWRMAG